MRYKVLLLVLLIFLTGCGHKPSESLDLYKDEDDGEQREEVNIKIYKELDNNMPVIIPKDFEIIFEYGVSQAEQHDSINTIDNVITKDLVLEGLVSSELVLESKDLENIYNELRRVNIIEYPSNFAPPYKDNPDPDINMICTPSDEYTLKICYEDVEYNLYWNNYNGSMAKNALNLKECFNRIINIIRNTDEYKLFPESNGYYE